MSPDHPDATSWPKSGRFVAVVGPSGAGKDTLMALAAREPALAPGIVFARRVVTRAALVAAEDHDSLDEAAFARAHASGAYCLAWAAHGHRYGLPRDLEDAVRRGSIVVANVSRRALADAAAAFGEIAVVEVTASPEILRERMAARGRETEAMIEDRLRREAATTRSIDAAYHVRIDNSGRIEAAVELFVRSLNALAVTPDLSRERQAVTPNP